MYNDLTKQKNKKENLKWLTNNSFVLSILSSAFSYFFAGSVYLLYYCVQSLFSFCSAQAIVNLCSCRTQQYKE